MKCALAVSLLLAVGTIHGPAEELQFLMGYPFGSRGITAMTHEGTVLYRGGEIVGDFIPGNREEELLGTWDYSVTLGRTWAMSDNNYLFRLHGYVASFYNPKYGTAVPLALEVSPVDGNIRFVTSAGESYLINPGDVLHPQVLASPMFAAGDQNFSLPPFLTGLAFDNNFPGATMTRLYGLDAATDSLVYFDDPNGSTIHTVGPLGLDVSGFVGFDISGLTGTAYASLNNHLYTVDLQTGAATYISAIDDTGTVIDLTTVETIPEPSTLALALLGGVLLVRQWRRREE